MIYCCSTSIHIRGILISLLSKNWKVVNSNIDGWWQSGWWSSSNTTFHDIYTIILLNTVDTLCTVFLLSVVIDYNR